MNPRPALAALLSIEDERERLDGLLSFAATGGPAAERLTAAEAAITVAQGVGNVDALVTACAHAAVAAAERMELEGAIKHGKRMLEVAGLVPAADPVSWDRALDRLSFQTASLLGRGTTAVAVSSCSQALQEPASTWRIDSEREPLRLGRAASRRTRCRWRSRTNTQRSTQA